MAIVMRVVPVQGVAFQVRRRVFQQPQDRHAVDGLFLRPGLPEQFSEGGVVIDAGDRGGAIPQSPCERSDLPTWEEVKEEGSEAGEEGDAEARGDYRTSASSRRPIPIPAW